MAGGAVLLAGLMGLGTPAGSGVTKRPSGGRAVAHRNERVIAVKRLPIARTYSVNRQAQEPTIGIGMNDSIFMTAAGWTGPGGTNVTDIMRSDDGGKSWTDSSPRVLGQNEHPTTLDPYIFVDDNETYRVFSIDLTVACSYMSFSDDSGATWTTNPLACGRPVNDHQTLFAGPPVSSPTVGYPNIVYYCWNDVATSSCSKSLDGGITFTPTGRPPFAGLNQSGNDICGGIHGHGVVGTDGTVYLPREHCDRLVVAISHDEGATWDTVEPGNGKGLAAEAENGRADDPSIAVDHLGNLYYTWIQAGDFMPYMSVSKDGGETWSDPIPIAAPGINRANFATIDVGKPGRIAIAYFGSENISKQCRVVYCTSEDFADVTWNGYLTISTNALAKTPTFITGTINDPSEPLHRGRCGPGRCSRAWDFIDVAISHDGNAYGVYVDGCMSDCEIDDGGREFEGLVSTLVGAPPLQ